MDEQELLIAVRDSVSRVSGQDVIDDLSFSANGVDSLGLMDIAVEVEGTTAGKITIADLINFPTPQALATALAIRHYGGFAKWLVSTRSSSNVTFEAYRDLVTGTPYNSARAFFEKYVGDDLGAGNWGHNCIGLSLAAGQGLLDNGCPTYLKWGRRRPLVFAHGGEIYFADPYALHQECINVTEVFSSVDTSCLFRCFPDVGHGMTLTFDSSSNELVQEKTTPRGSMFCRYPMEGPLASVVDPLSERLLFDNEQDNLSIRVLTNDLSSTAHLVIPLPAAYRVRSLRTGLRPTFFALRNDEVYDDGSAGFKSTIAIVAERVNVSPVVIRDFLEVAFCCYMDNAPEGLTFAKGHSNGSNL